MEITDKTEMTLRADVDGLDLQKAKLPPPIKLTAKEALTFAAWAMPISGTAMLDVEIMVSDIKPTAAVRLASDLPKGLRTKVMPALEAARRHGFGLRIMRETPSDPYTVTIPRRVIDVPQMTVPFKSLKHFLLALSPVANDLEHGRMTMEAFAYALDKRADVCMDMGCAHYRQFALSIVEYGVANGASQVVWGPERRGMGS